MLSWILVELQEVSPGTTLIGSSAVTHLCQGDMALVHTAFCSELSSLRCQAVPGLCSRCNLIDITHDPMYQGESCTSTPLTKHVRVAHSLHCALETEQANTMSSDKSQEPSNEHEVWKRTSCLQAG